MAYDIQAFIADEAAIRSAVPEGAAVIRLTQGKAMIPLSDRVREAHDLPFLPLTDEGASEVPDGISAIGEAIARQGKVAYVEAEFFGGVGAQACVTWDAAGQPSQPLVDVHAINTALQFLGVAIGDHHDEFDALGLGRHRATNEWLRTAEPGASQYGGPAERFGSSGVSGGPPSVNPS
jgi:hypothetical protein